MMMLLKGTRVELAAAVPLRAREGNGPCGVVAMVFKLVVVPEDLRHPREAPTQSFCNNFHWDLYRVESEK
jgi:hypothetical protein